MIRLIRIMSLLVCTLALASTAWAAGPWIGRIVDFDTGAPLEGVVVLAVWERTVPGIVEAVDRFHRAFETVTDKDGYFEIRPTPPLTYYPLSVLSTARMWSFLNRVIYSGAEAEQLFCNQMQIDP